jgi:hypothetical protein
MTPSSDLRFHVASAPDDRPPFRLRLRLIPTLIGIVAVLNVASVVMALIQ